MLKQKTIHQPVLLNEVLAYLEPKVGESYLDVTAGYGGHAAAIIARTTAPELAVLTDRDPQAAQELMEKFGSSRVVNSDFLETSKQLLAEGKQFDMILADLGVSSPHLDHSQRGFSLSETGPLDMRMDQRQPLTAAELVNNWSEDRISDILKQFGQEPKARQIASLIVRSRPIETTSQLAKIASQAWPGKSRRHPATRTFQAIRIAVNSELEQLEQALPIWIDLLSSKGRLAVISFHSLEDKIVKDFLADESTGYTARIKLLAKKPITATPHEIVLNPRARSAKLRVAAK